MKFSQIVCTGKVYRCAKFEHFRKILFCAKWILVTDFGVRDAENFKVPHRLLTLLTPSDKQKACCLDRKNELILFN